MFCLSALEITSFTRKHTSQIMSCDMRVLEKLWSWDREKLLTDTQNVQPHAALAQPLNPTVQKQYPPLEGSSCVQTANTYRTPKSAEIEKKHLHRCLGILTDTERHV